MNHDSHATVVKFLGNYVLSDFTKLLSSTVKAVILEY